LSGPQVEGTPAVEQTLTCKEGTWTGQPAPEYSFQWVVNGSAVPSATTNKFKIGTADSGYNIACRVTGTNNSGSASALSRSVHVPGKGPETLVQPSIKGSASVGAQLTCERGVWAGKPPPTFTYQWYRGSSPIAGATEETYVVETADMGYALSCNVLGANSEGSVEQESTNLVVIASHTSTGPGGGSTTTGPGTTKTTVPNAAEILATIKRQVVSALSESHLKKIAKAGSFSFSFIAPGAGAFEVEWYEVDPVHGKSKDIVLGKAHATYTKVSRQTIKLKLDAAGRSLLKGKHSVKLHVKGLFTLRGHRPVVWTGSIVLHA
jgi:hypothetical protein